MTYAGWWRQRQGAASGTAGEASAPGVTFSGATLAASADDQETDLCDEAASEERDPAALPSVSYFEAGKGFAVGDIDVEPFTIPHDAADPVGFVFEGEGVRIGFATDLGYMPANARQALRRCDVLLLESNHDTEMLRDGPYPWSVKQRVMSRVGHLSNEAAAEFLERNYDGQARYVILAHLSESNNLPALARVSAERALCDRMSLLANKVLLAEQGQPLETIAL
jgi:phosphoribosyl 1,2-cyclic phosphodiesterase